MYTDSFPPLNDFLYFCILKCKGLMLNEKIHY